MNNEEFNQRIQDIVSKYNTTYLEAVVHYCEKNSLEIETVVPLMKNNSKLKSELQDEAESLNLIEKTNKLPL